MKEIKQWKQVQNMKKECFNAVSQHYVTDDVAKRARCIM